MIRLWKVATIKLEDIKPLPKNVRFIQEKNLKGLRKSLEKFGVVELPIFNQTTGHLIGGHQRISILQEKEVKETPMIVVEMDEETELAASLSINNPTIMGEFTPAIVEILETIEGSEKELYKALNLDMLRISLKDFVPKIPPNPPSGETDFAIPPGANEEGMTKCPCCSHKWSISARDVLVEPAE